MRVVILNNKSEAVDYDKFHRRPDDRVIPIGPGARHIATVYGWDFCPLSSLWEEEEYYNARDESEIKTKTLVNELNNYSKSISKNFPLTIGDYFSFQLHIVIGQIHYNHFILNSIKKTLSPNSLLIYYPGVEKKIFMGFRPDPEMIFFDALVSSSLFKNSEVIKKNTKSNSHSSNSWKQWTKDMLPTIIFEKLLALKQKFRTGNLKTSGKQKLLMLGPEYDWGPLFNDGVFQEEYHVDYAMNERLNIYHSTPHKLEKILNQSIENDGSTPFDLSKQAKIIYGTLLKMDKEVLNLKNKISKYHAVLSTIYVFPRQNLVGHLANTLGVPIINWQHGEMNITVDGSDFVTEATETRHTNYYFCYGDHVAPKYESYIGSSRMKRVFTVGATKKIIKWESKKHIIYASGKWMKTATPITQVIDADSRLYASQFSLLNYMNSIGDTHEVIFKPNNSPGLNENPFEYQKIKVDYSNPFTALLKNAKIVILDCPGTTCIEVCSTEIPLFVLTGRAKWREQATKLLKKRAVLEDTPEKLIKRVENYLIYGNYPADPSNKEYFNGYGGGHLNITEVNSKALQALRELTHKK
jgi:hypothetical protein